MKIKGKRHFFIVLIVFFFVYMLFSVYEEIKQKTIDDFNSQQLILAKQAAQGIENYFKHYFLELKYLASFDDVILSNQLGKKILNNFYEIHSNRINAITYVNAAGKIIHTAPFDAKAIGVDISHQNHVQTILSTHKPVISDIFMAVQGYKAVAYHVPIIKNEIYLGSLALLIPFSRLTNENLTNIKMRKSGYAWVINQTGIELFCPVPGHVGKTIVQNSSEFPSLVALAEKMKQGQSGISQYIDNKSPNIQSYQSLKQAAYFPINLGNTHWSIAVATPENEVLSAMKTFRNKRILISLIMGLAVFAYLYLAFRSLNQSKEEKNRKASDAALKKSEEKYRELAQSSNSIILKTDQNFNFIFFNQYAQDFFGFSEDEIIGENLIGTIVPEIESSGRNLKSFMEEIIENPDVFANNENENTRKNGERVWVAWRNKCIYDGDGKFTGLLCTGYDITERKHTEEKLKKAHSALENLVEARTIEYKIAKEEAESANIAKSEFLSNMSHEIRTPMHQILSFSQFGVSKYKQVNPEKIQYYFSKISMIGKQLMLLLDDLLDLSKLEAGKMIYDMAQYDLKTIINNLSQEYHPLLMDKRLTLKIEEYHISTEVVCDEYKIGQVMRNLLSNAIKFTPKNKNIKIAIASGVLPDEHMKGIESIKISVMDEGPGIPENELMTIFNKFIQSSTTKTGAGGTGLGLAICKEIINAHHGNIWVENNLNGGSTFSFMLPNEQKANI